MKEIAIELNALDIYERLNRAEQMSEGRRIGIAVMGSVNCGKTMLINGILGQVVREPSLLPSEGKPLRVVFERTADDPRFDCAFVFHAVWMNMGVTLYEFSEQTLFEEESQPLLDEIDFVYYCMPANRFMTAKDREALSLLAPIPTQIIVTKVDELPRKDHDAVFVYIKAACEAAALSAPLMADESAWETVSRQMRDQISLTEDWTSLRRVHADAVTRSCRKRLLERIEQLTAREEEALETDERQRQIDWRAAQLQEAQHRKDLSEMKLRCTRASNAAVDRSREILKNTHQWVLRFYERGQKARFSEEFFRASDAEIVAFFKDEVNAVSDIITADTAGIGRDALQLGLLDAQPAVSTVGIEVSSQPSIQTKEDANKSYLLKTAGIIGTAGLIAICMPPSSLIVKLLTFGILGGGSSVLYSLLHSDSRNKEISREFTDAVKQYSENLERELVEAIQNHYNTVSHALHLPSAETVAPVDSSGRAVKVGRLQELAEKLRNE